MLYAGGHGTTTCWTKGSYSTKSCLGDRQLSHLIVVSRPRLISNPEGALAPDPEGAFAPTGR
jgi:hypothetical protein